MHGQHGFKEASRGASDGRRKSVAYRLRLTLARLEQEEMGVRAASGFAEIAWSTPLEQAFHTVGLK